MREVIVAAFGLVFGSFTNVLIDRIPRGESIIWKPSHCDHCKKPLRWFELIPLVSYLVIAGKCMRCKKPIPWEYPVVELLTAMGFVGAFVATNGDMVQFLALAALWIATLAIFGIDMHHQIIPDSLLILMLGAVIVLLGSGGSGVLLSHVVPATISGLFFLTLWFITRGRGLGFGDVKLSVIMGLLLGHPGAIIAFYVSFLTGAIAGVILMIGRRAHMKSRIAFGPFLLIGMWVAWAWGRVIADFWQRLL